MIHEEIAVVAFMVKLTSFPIVAVVDCLIDNQIQAILLGCCCNRLCRGEGKQWWWVHGSRRGRSTCQDGTWPPLLHHHAPLAGTGLVTQEGAEHMVIIYCPHLCTIYSLSITPTTIPTISSPAAVSLHWRFFFLFFVFFPQIRTHGPIRE